MPYRQNVTNTPDSRNVKPSPNTQNKKITSEGIYNLLFPIKKLNTVSYKQCYIYKYSELATLNILMSYLNEFNFREIISSME